MIKKYSLTIVIISIFLLSPVISNAQTSTNTDKIVSLTAQINSLLKQIQLLQEQLAGQDSTVTFSSSTSNQSCFNPTYNLYLGLKDSETGDEVTKLQKFLANDSTIYPEGLITGFFGPMTERAVKKWQAKNSVVSSGSPDTTGYGVIGPKTREKIIGVCGGTSSSPVITPPVVVIPVSPTVTPTVTPTPPTISQPVASTQPSITVLSPNGGETFIEGSQVNIRWNTNGLSSNQKLDIVLNVGLSGPGEIIANDVTNTGSYLWTAKSLESFYASEGGSWIVPSGKYTISVVCSQQNYANCNFNRNFGISDSVFMITKQNSSIPLSITVQSPNGGEVWKDNISEYIYFTSNFSKQSVKIWAQNTQNDLVTIVDESYVTIDSNPNRTGWSQSQIPLIAGSYKICVGTDINNPLDCSDSAFIVTSSTYATIDSNTLTTSSQNPTLSGTANINSIIVQISNSVNVVVSGNTVSVINGRWVLTIPQTLQPDTYKVEILGLSIPVYETLTIVVSLPSGTIDQSSLKTLTGSPIITGSANVSTVGFSISDGEKLYGSGSIPVVNGRWSHQVSENGLPSTNYTLSLYSDNVLLATSSYTETPTCTLTPSSVDQDLSYLPNFAVEPYSSATLTVTSQNATYAVLNGEKMNSNFSWTVNNLITDTNYNVTVYGKEGNTATCNATIYIDWKG